MSKEIAHNTEESSRWFTAVSALLAFVLWGSWAFYVNQSAGLWLALISAITQGTFSALMTVVIVRVIGFLIARVPSSGLATVLPSLITTICSSALLVFTHMIVGTENILQTVVLPILVAFAFCLVATFKLKRSKSS